MKHRLGLGILLGLAMLFLVPAVSSAQSAIVGLLTDDSGGVLPGVTAEATSPAMIEGARQVVTDSQGRYRFEAMRPGVYKLAFSLTGFGTVVREGITCSNFTARECRNESRLAQETSTVGHRTAGRRAAGVEKT